MSREKKSKGQEEQDVFRRMEAAGTNGNGNKGNHPHVPRTSRSGLSERQGDDDEGAMAPGKGEPHEDDQEPYNQEHRMASPAEAGNQHDGPGEFADQREAVEPQYRLGYPADDRVRPSGYDAGGTHRKS